MTNSFFPKSDPDLLVWATNYKNKIAANATVLNLSAAQVSNEIDNCNALIASINAVAANKAALKSAVDAKTLSIEMQGGALRTEIARHKLAPEFTNAIGQDLGVMSVNLGFDPNIYKAKINVEVYAGYARIKFTKRGVDGVNLYHRKKGTTNWLFMARVTKSPFDDRIVLQTAGQPEHWEYRAYGVLNDLEIGIASDIVEIIIGI